MTKSRPEIGDLRHTIDDIDNTILELLKKRLGCAREIGLLKDSANRAKWDPKREKEIYDRLLADNNGVFSPEALRSIFHEIITTCRLSQKPVAVSFIGPEGSFSHLAGLEHFGRSAAYHPSESIAEVFAEVEKRRSSRGIVPMENSIEGAIFSTLEGFLHHDVKICGEVNLPISYSLVCSSGDAADIRTIVSHATPLAQCRNWLKKNMPQIPTLPVFSTGRAAQMAAEDPEIGAITSSLAIKIWELQVVVREIEDRRDNATRYLVIGSDTPPPTGTDRTSLLLGVENRPGALSDALSVLAEMGVNLAKIESRLVKDRTWNVLILLDLFGHIEDDAIARAIDRLTGRCLRCDWLGSYPRSPASRRLSANF